MEEHIPSLEELITYQDIESQGFPIVESDEPKPNKDEIDTTNDDGADDATESDSDDTGDADDSSNEPGDDDDDDTVQTDVSTDTDGDTGGEDGDDGTPTGATDAINVYQNYYDHLTESGFLLLGDDFKYDGTPEKLEEAFAISETNKWELLKGKMLEKIPEEGKPLLEYFMAGGTNIDAYLDTYGDIDFETVDITNVKDQKRVLKEYYKRTSNYPDDKIDRMIDKLEALDSLQEDSAEAIKELKDLEVEQRQQLITQAQGEILAKEKRFREEKEAITSAVENAAEIGDKRKNQVKAFLFNQVTRGEQTTTDYNRVLSQISSNPNHIAQLADILLDYDPRQGFNMSRFEAKGKTKANKTFRDTLDAKLDPSSKMKGKSSTPTKESVNWEELLRQIDSGATTV